MKLNMEQFTRLADFIAELPNTKSAGKESAKLAKLLGVCRVTYIKSKGKCLLTLYEGDKLKEIYAPDLLKEVAYDYRGRSIL